VEREDGTRVTIAVADIVSGKPVPPRPSVRLRVSAEEAERRALRGWPATESEPLGDWVLRAAGGFTARANSVLAVGSPGLPLDEALVVVTDFYAARGLPPWAQVVVGSDGHRALADRGWVHARPGEADTEFQVASVARVARALRATSPSRRAAEPAPCSGEVSPGRPPGPVVTSTATDAWLADDDPALRDRVAACGVLEGPAEVAFVTLGDPAVAKGRVSLHDDWAGITDVWVAPDHRRRGLALEVMRELVGWAAERGATTAYLQARGDNPAALDLYDRLGFVTHHTYRYLTPTRQ
jgi:ribosomal protein S18 acetylase RimI-like enzyme